MRGIRRIRETRSERWGRMPLSNNGEELKLPMGLENLEARGVILRYKMPRNSDQEHS